MVAQQAPTPGWLSTGTPTGSSPWTGAARSSTATGCSVCSPLDLHRRGRLAGDTVVVTVMTNLGFHLAMADAGVTVHQTQVGDRQVLEALDARGWSLGGSSPAT